MSDDKIQTLHQFGMGDQLKIHLAENIEVGGTTLSTPYATTVSSVRKERLDHNRGDDVDGIVHRREIYIEPHPDDDVHEEYVITTDSPIIGQKSVSSIEARDWFEGRPGNGKYSVRSMRFGKVEPLD